MMRHFLRPVRSSAGVSCESAGEFRRAARLKAPTRHQYSFSFDFCSREQEF